MLTSQLALVGCCLLLAAAEPVAVQLPDGPRPEPEQELLLQALKVLLNQTSQSLHKATGSHFEEVVFLIPSTWETSSPRNYDYFDAVTKTDVVVTSRDDSVFGKGPHALQFGPCGSRGLRIDVPQTFLLRQTSENLVANAKRMSREWIKYRYGVFDEFGFANDARYPLYSAVPGTENAKVTDCTNTVVQYSFRDNYSRECLLEVDPKTGLPNSDCLAVPDPNANDNVTSSLMSFLSLPTVEFLCGDEGHPHQSRSPNKQNVLCHGKSILDVLKQNNDLKNQWLKESASVAPDPMFRYSKEIRNRIVIAVDASLALRKYQDIIRNAVANLIYSLPSGSEFGITVTDGLHTIPETDDLNDINNLILKAKLVFTEPRSCPECVLRKALQMLNSSTKEKYGTIILLSSANPVDVDAALLTMKPSGTCLTAVLFLNATANGYSDVLRSFPCTSVVDVPDDTSFSTLRLLYETLERSVKPSYRKKTKLRAGEIIPRQGIEFVVDQTVSRLDLWLSNRSSEMDINEKSLRVYPVDAMEAQIQRVTSVPNVMVLRVENPVAAKWKCELDYDSSLFLKVIVTSKASESLTVEAWFLDTSEKGQEVQRPIILYARVMQGMHPVIDASVKAEVKVPNGEAVVLHLMDNGLGDPDITKYDGVYSRYFIQFTTPGKYEVTVMVNDNDMKASVAKPNSQAAENLCCGSKVMAGLEVKNKAFYREAKLYFTARGKYPDNGYAPSTILDLQVTAEKRSLFKLKWTAPGGKKDHGKGAKYVLQQHQTYEDSITVRNRDIKVDGFQSNISHISPRSYGENEEMELHATESMMLNTSYFLSLITWNENGLQSDMSNIVEIFLHPDLTDITSEPNSTSSTLDENRNSNEGLSGATIGYIVGAVFLVILIICGYVAFCFYTKRKEKQDEEEPDKTEDKQKRTNNNNNDDDGSVTANGWKLDQSAISPVNSVPASVLLYHHEQVKDAKRKNQEPPLFKLEHLMENEDKISHSSTQNLTNPHTVPKEASNSSEGIILSPQEYVQHSPSYVRPHYDDPPTKPGRRVTNV